MLKNKTLVREEFMIFVAYVMFVQGSQLAGSGFSTPTSTPVLNFNYLFEYLS